MGGGGDSAVKGQTWDHSLISHCLAHGIQMSKQSPQGCSVIKSTATPRPEQDMGAHGLVAEQLTIPILVPRAKHWVLHSRFHPQASSSDGRDSTLAGRGEDSCWGPALLALPKNLGQLAASIPSSGSESTPLLLLRPLKFSSRCRAQ